MNSNFFSLFFLPDTKEFLFCDRAQTSYLFYKDFKLNLLTGERTDSSLSELDMFLDQFKVSDNLENPIVWHLYYELGFSYVEQEKNVPIHKPLALFVQYQKSQVVGNIQKILPKDTSELLLEATEYPQFKTYKDRFNKVFNYLLDGECYQVNLTDGFYFKFENGHNHFDFLAMAFKNSKNLGAFAHATYVECLAKLFLSNSPECLFSIKKLNDKFNIVSMPIKGTIKTDEKKSRSKAWVELKNSKKDQGELFMITDLIRNDLSKVEFKKSVVKNKKLPLYVPGLVHQYSIVHSEISEDTSLLNIIRAIFPGGSITGAPKKRVMKIINEIEDFNRGFYCGSTVIMHKQMKAASINIRSSVIDFSSRELFYGSGGGITLLSNVKDEFDESYSKMESFLHFLKVKNVNKS